MENTRYIGDDLIDLMTITISSNNELPDIETVELRIGNIQKKFIRPSNPFTISIPRMESVKLATRNKCYAAIWYWGEVKGNRILLKKTCEGTITIPLNPEVIHGGY